MLMDVGLKYLARNPEPISRSALAAAIGGRRKYALKAVKYLVSDGHVQFIDRKVVPANGNDSRNAPR